jgi:hypothetical protein
VPHVLDQPFKGVRSVLHRILRCLKNSNSANLLVIILVPWDAGPSSHRSRVERRLVAGMRQANSVERKY